MKKEDVIYPAAGIIFYPEIGDYIKEGDVIAELHSNKKLTVANSNKVVNALLISEKKCKKAKLIHKVIS